jgi:predicted RNA methylase
MRPVGDEVFGMQLEVDEADVQLLQSLLQSHAVTLSHEIHKAATREFRKKLEEEESRTKALLNRLRAIAGPGGTSR